MIASPRWCRAEHFFDPVHARIFEIAAARIQKNALASPVTLKAFLEDDAGLKELGGPAYLARLAGAAISAYAARDYAQMIYDLAVRRELMALGRDISAKAAKVEVESEPREQIIEAEQRLYKLGEQGVAERGFQSFLKAVTDAVNVANAAYQRDGGLAGISTGLIDLDKKLGGLHPSDLLILAGRPSMGKTSLATNIAFNIAKAYKRGRLHDGTEGAVEGGVVGFFSLEMSAEQLAARILSEASEVPSEQIRRGDMTEAEFRRFVEAAKALESCPLYIDDTPALPISQVAARARRLKRTHGLDVLMVDYLQLLKGSSQGEPGAGSVRDHAGPQGHRQGARHPRRRPCRSSRARSKTATTSARNCPTCANPARSSRMPTWSCSSTATSITASARSPAITNWKRWRSGSRPWNRSTARPR